MHGLPCPVILRHRKRIAEDLMRARQWRLRRHVQPRPDGQQRWDRAYQQLLRWSTTPNMSSPPMNPQEDSHASSHLCARLHPTAGPGADD